MIFIEETGKLFRRANPEMTEEKTLRFLMCGVKEELFSVLARKPPKTVNEFITEPTSIEGALKMRAEEYDQNFVGAGNANYVDKIRIPPESLRETIRAVVTEKRRKFVSTQQQPQVATLTDVVREVQQALATLTPLELPCEPQPMTYSAAVR